MVESLRPDRIGHGILAAGEPELMDAIRAAEITLEICPTSNLLTKALADEDAVRETFRAFVEHGVPFTIATDGPEMMRTHLRDEFELLTRIGALDDDEARPRTRGATKCRSSAAERTLHALADRYTLRPMESAPRARSLPACRHFGIHQASPRGSGRSSS